MDNEQEVEWVEIGRISVQHGIRGEVKVQPMTDFAPQRLGKAGTRYMLPPKGPLRRAQPQPLPVTLQYGRSIIYKGHDMWLVKLEGYDTPEAVRELRNYTLLIREDDRDPDEDLEDDDEFYVQELVGMEVVLVATGECIGTVAALYDGTGTHDVLRIRLHPDALPSTLEESNSEEDAQGLQRTVLLPFVRDLVPEVDLEEGVMHINPPEGLLEATLVVEKGKQHVSPNKRRRAAARRHSMQQAQQRAAQRASKE